ncbi:MAG: UDP-3-O-acyl-N-acetylglucosamine deacetylase [Nitrosomonadales bacterium]|nr:UDP-3-O-acyl-N-acetylglucosamine deacetylase [Nitrosomonadales bacterium]
MIFQKTIKNEISEVGVGLHSGEKVKITLKPGSENQGIVFKKINQKKVSQVKVDPTIVLDTRLCSTIGNADFQISTVEHLMSALCASGVDNITIEVSGSEIPIMDGSAITFIHLIKSAGIVDQLAPKQFIRIKKTIEVREDDKFAIFEPFQGFIIDFTIDFPHPVFKTENSHVSIDFFQDSYVQDISRARTFGFMQEVEALRSNGLARGGSLDNAIVVDDYKIINKDGLRYKDEFVRHKILDAMGDLFMLGKPLLGKFTAFKSGHDLNNKLIRKLAQNPDTWEVATLDLESDDTAHLAKQYLNSKLEFNSTNYIT